MNDSHPGRADGSIEWVPASVRQRYSSIGLRVDRVGELVQVGVESPQETHGGVPAHPALAPLNPTHERGVRIEAFGELLLGEPGPAAQLT